VGGGRFDVAEIEAVLATRPSGGAGLASSLFVIGAFLKLVPPWVGSRPVAVPATLVAQIALLGAMLRMRGWLFDLGPTLDVVIGVLAVGWMLVGSLAALGRRPRESVLASTFLVHAGLAALGVVAGGDEGREAVLFYLLTFLMSGLGAWAAAGRDGSGGDEKVGRPSRTAFLLFVGSLAGAPLTIGFVGRLQILRVAVDQNETVGVAVALLSLTVCFYVYARMALDVLWGKPEAELSSVKAGRGRAVVLVVCAAVILSAGVWPGPGLALVKQVAMEFF
jgi:NADH-quinone oxidoreductase subunit N